MSVRINHVQLPRSIRPRPPRREFYMVLREIFFPRIKIIDQQRKVIAPIVRHNLPIPPADQMQFLIDSQPKPGTRKAEGRSWNWLQVQHIAIECDALFTVGNVQSNVTELSEAHERRLWSLVFGLYVGVPCPKV